MFLKACSEWHVPPSTTMILPNPTSYFQSLCLYLWIMEASGMSSQIIIIKFFIDWTSNHWFWSWSVNHWLTFASNFVENRAMAKVPVIDLSPFLQAQEKAPRRDKKPGNDSTAVVAVIAAGIKHLYITRKHFLHLYTFLYFVPWQAFPFSDQVWPYPPVFLSSSQRRESHPHTKARCDNQRLTWGLWAVF